MTEVSQRLTVEEDEALRRLHWFEEHGCALSEDQRALKASIRARDRRAEIRIPRQAVDAVEAAPPGADPEADA